MHEAIKNDQPPLLQYADMPPGIGLIIEPLSDGVRITRPANRGAAIALLVFLLLISPLGLLLIFLSGDPDGLRLPIRIIRGAFKPTIIEVTATTLSLLNVELNGRPFDLIRARKDVYDVRFIEHSGNLFIRAHGQEIIDFRPFHDRRILGRLAETLRKELRMEDAVSHP
jgi:hypothetical protein